MLAKNRSQQRFHHGGKGCFTLRVWVWAWATEGVGVLAWASGKSSEEKVNKIGTPGPSARTIPSLTTELL